MGRTAELREALRSGGPVVGLWAVIPSSLTTELAAAAGPAYVVVDQQHGALAPAGLTAMLQGIDAGGSTPLVRVARNDPFWIGQALDLGAAGVIVPMVDDADAAARAVSACRYAPAGERSYGALRGGGPAGDPPLCLTMIETRAGLENAEAIAATPGLDGIYVGPSDLSLSLGLQVAGHFGHQPVLEAIARVRAACAANEVICGVHCTNAEDAARWAGEGVAMVTAGADLGHLAAGLAAALATARRPLS
jgi:4-hydroxy-2-oxoheptanedioate aldolase